MQLNEAILIPRNHFGYDFFEPPPYLEGDGLDSRCTFG